MAIFRNQIRPILNIHNDNFSMLSEFCKMPLLPLYTVVTTFDPLLTQDPRHSEPQQLALQLALTNKQSMNATRPWGYGMPWRKINLILNLW